MVPHSAGASLEHELLQPAGVQRGASAGQLLPHGPVFVSDVPESEEVPPSGKGLPSSKPRIQLQPDVSAAVEKIATRRSRAKCERAITRCHSA
jgi:hypothetical protein